METASPKHPKFVRWALMLGIVIILNIFFVELVSLVLPTPQLGDYCPAANSEAPAPTDPASCDASGGTWVDTGPATAPAGTSATNPSVPLGYCDQYSQCQPLYQAASDKHDLYAFAFMVGLGIIALLAGLMPIGSSIVSTGLSYGGVIALIIGSIQYWGSAGQWVRLLIAAVGLGALLYIGWRRFKD